MQPSDLERLIHESLEQLGWQADSKALAERIGRLNIGLPAEDEFTILCGWLGKCELIHKLDQQQYPVDSKLKYQVPDLLARFNYKERKITALIEVKSSNKNALSFTPEYRSKLIEYGNILGLPVLVAWKHSFGIWMLVSLDCFEKRHKNFNLSFSTAMQENLLGVLAGDFTYSLGINSGFHLACKKDHLISTEPTDNEETEVWHTTIDEVYFTNRDNENIKNLSKIAQQVFFSWNLEYHETHSDSHIIMHYTCQEQSGLFAHMALTRILNFHLNENDRIHWRKHLKDESIISSIKDYRAGIEENLRNKVIHHIIDQLPRNLPAFLREI